MKAEITQTYEIDKVQCGSAKVSEWNDKIVIKDDPLCIMFEKDKSEITIYLNNNQSIRITPTEDKPIVGYTPDTYNIKPKKIYPTEVLFYKLEDYDTLHRKEIDE